MSQKSKTYTVRFYKSRCDGSSDILWQVLSELVERGEPLQVMPAGDTAYQIRGLKIGVDMKSITGYLVMLPRWCQGHGSGSESRY
ncbi:hypothetical protein [Xenorhabdus siamensis]|uniref:hypothetical protein n=1 Tax=Xenorhabdus siamensis TaxID=3136254 RepID=UPI0030F4453F